MSFMFANCNQLTLLDVSSFDTQNVTNMSSMFTLCKHITNLDISNFNTETVTDMSYMFEYCSCLTNIIVNSEKWNTNKLQFDQSMFGDCLNLTGGKGTKLNPNKVGKEYACIDGGNDNPGYFTEKK